jgi:hypothetical protein
MSDTINALTQQARQSSLLGVLSSADVVNPLAAQSAGMDVASKYANLQSAIAQRAVGQIAAQSIDPVTKQFDQSRFNAGIAAAGPVVAAYAQPGLQNASTLADTQTRQQLLKVGWYNGATGALPDNASYDQVVNTIKSGASVGMTPTEIENSIAQVPRDPAQLQSYIQQHRLTAGNTVTQLEQRYGTRQAVTDPSGTQYVTVPPAGPNQPNVVVPAGMGPGAAGAQVQWPDSSGVVHYGTQAQYQQARGVDPRIGPQTPVLAPPPNAPRQPGSNAPPPPPGNGKVRIPSPGAYVTPGGNAPASTGSSAGGKVPPTAPGPQSQNVPPAGAVSSDVAAIQGGMQTAKNTLSGSVPGAVAAAGPAAGTSTAAPAYTDTTGPPAGFGERLKQDQEQYAADQRNLNNRYTNTQNLRTALDALKLTNTGRSTGAVHNFYSFLSSQGIAPGFVDNDVTQYDIARKAMMAFAASRAASGGTDLARVQSELSNASPEIAQGAALHVLKQNLGLENMEIAANQQHGDKSGAGYGESKAKFYQQNDPRAFAWDSYEPEERAAIIEDAKKTEGGLDKLRASLRKAIDLGLVKKPAQRSEAAPASNGAPATAPANALLAASANAPANALAA